MAGLRTRDIDGGYAYAILTGSIVMYMIVIGGAKSYGLLYTEMYTYFKGSASDTGWSTGINLCIITGMGPLSNSLAKRYSFRLVTFLGGLLAGTGYVLSSFVPTMEYTYLTFGVITGLGLGLALSPSTTLVSFFFIKHRFLANGVTFAFSGLWAASISFVYEYLVTTYGLRGTLLICGGIHLHICAAACLFIQPDELSNHLEKTSEDEANATRGLCAGITPKCRWIRDEAKIYIALLRIPSFSLFQISLMLMMYSYNGALLLLAAEVDIRGLPKVHESINIAILGICDVVARLFFGWFSDLKLVQTRYLYILNILLGATFTILVPFVKSLIFLRIYAGAGGLFIASYMALLPPHLIETFGLERFPQAMGLSFLSMSIVLLIGHPTLGLTADITGDWDAAFLLCGAVLLVAALILASEPVVSRWCSKKQDEKEEEKKEEGTGDNLVFTTRL